MVLLLAGCPYVHRNYSKSLWDIWSKRFTLIKSVSNCKDNGVKEQSRPQSFGLTWQNRQNPFFSWPNTSWRLGAVLLICLQKVFRKIDWRSDFCLHHWCLFFFKVFHDFQTVLNHYREKWSIVTSFRVLFWRLPHFFKRGLDLYEIYSSFVGFLRILSLLLRFVRKFSYLRMVGVTIHFLVLLLVSQIQTSNSPQSKHSFLTLMVLIHLKSGLEASNKTLPDLLAQNELV